MPNQDQSGFEQNVARVLLIGDGGGDFQSLKSLLEGQDLDFVVATCGKEAVSIYNEYKDEISVIVLDWHLTDLTGIQVLNEIGIGNEWYYIPVIMLADKMDENLFIEGMDTGAHYFLPKKFSKKHFLAILDRALKDHAKYVEHVKRVKYKVLHRLIRRGTFQINTLLDAHEVADWLASLCVGARNDIVVGFIELLVNAVEHGLLGIGFDRKTELLKKGNYLKVIDEMQDDEKYANKFVEVSFSKVPNGLEVVIDDKGKGFDFSKFIKFDKKRMFDAHGRGIFMAKTIYFEELEYLGNGSKVRVLVSWPESEA